MIIKLVGETVRMVYRAVMSTEAQIKSCEEDIKYNQEELKTAGFFKRRLIKGEISNLERRLKELRRQSK